MAKENLPIVFGPVLSRRFGKSLGVDLSPSKKQCNYNCIYCELGKAKPIERMEEVIKVEILINAIQNALNSLTTPIDVLTITANGEPTLYPHLLELIQSIKPFLKGVKTLILSNGSLFYEPKVQQALKEFDIVKFSLDAIDLKAFERVDKPYSKDIDKILEGILSFSQIYQGQLVAEVLLIKGVNDSANNLKLIAAFLKKINIARVDLSTIDRPSSFKAPKLSEDELMKCSLFFEGLCVSLPKRTATQADQAKKLISCSIDELLALISRRPLSAEEAPLILDPNAFKHLETLLNHKQITIKKVGSLEFYCAF
ncbi:radical SAM protein [Helicobacter pylori]|uniref:radical SAM protein n=1 Tax=Helicobacter pylori TaxID=210 RepID=UPI00192065E7|nr:radical SAM protein [Helicobacter pylori]QQW62641.1 radical SAM protein [Helicobacter pylori]QQW65590.1 radical SAM protein [Helicobacter pylori]QQW94574.1 radical SAM protein [Helicobacter pylori]QQW97452.1 radical SAM protein [Helicobacter pylori]